MSLIGTQTAASETSARLELIAEVDLSGIDPDFAGLSGLEVDDAGHAFTAVSDAGKLFSGSLIRQGSEHELTDVSLTRAGDLPLLNGRKPRKKRQKDSEGLALASDGGRYVSFEIKHRILHYRSAQSEPQLITPPRPAQAWPSNRGLEALALSPNGDLVAIAEHSGRLTEGFALYLRPAQGGAWQTIAELPRGGDFRPVGLDYAPNGDLYILLRAFNGFGFATRIARLTGPVRQPGIYEQLFESGYGRFGNLEGLAVWTDPSGALRLLAVSDNNFKRFQRNQMVEFRLSNGLASPRKSE